jgi:RND family efflux transporter MFP subunit
MKAKISKIPKTILAGGVLAILIIAGMIGYLLFVYQAEVVEDKNTLQTTLVRRGDLTISASGTGSLSVSEEVELSFTSSGNVLGLYIKAGDRVKAGDLLAEIDKAEAQSEYDSAKRSYMELTSPVAVASALDTLAQAQKNYTDAVYQLEYLISPDVMYWELKIAEAEESLAIVKSQASANPSDEQAKKQVEDTEKYLLYAAELLKEAHVLYDNEYAFENFVRRDGEGHRYLAIPSELDIHQARLAVEDAEKALMEARTFYEALAGGVFPEDTDIPELLAIKTAQRTLGEAQAKLDGTRIFSPISGTVISVDMALGDQVDTDVVITLADLSQAYLEFYMDESDWDKTAIGAPTEIVFDSLPDTIFTGTISTVDSELYTSGMSTAVHGTVTLTSSFNEINLPIGASASVEVISVDLKNILLVPIEALHETSFGGYAVYLVTDNGVQEQSIEIGAKNELYVEVKFGLTEGDVVAIGIAEVE